MKITYEKLTLLRKLLNPISKVNESGIIKITPTETYSVTMSQKDSIIMYVQLKGVNKEVQNEVTLNIPNINKLIQVLDCIDDPFVDFTIESNHLAYNSPTIKFKYFLLDDGVIEVPPVKIDKINALQFDCTFELGSKAVKDLIRGGTFASETNKVYFYTKDQKVFAELTDQTIANTDSITFQIAEGFTGNDVKQVLPLSMEIIRLINNVKSDGVTVHVNTENKVLMFEATDSEHVIKMIVSSLVK